MPEVAIFIGSISDKDKIKPCADILDQLGIDYLFTVTSAHRTPARTGTLIRELEEKGCKVFICAAGMAAHLAGAVAAQTIRPVLGIPVNSSPLNGLDALLSTVQMPPGFPVGTLSLDKAGAKNAAWMAAQIIAIGNEDVAGKIREAREGFVAGVEEAAAQLERE